MEKTFDSCFPEVIKLLEEFTEQKFRPDWNYLIPVIHKIESMGYDVRINKYSDTCFGCINWNGEKVTEASHKDPNNQVDTRFRCAIVLLYHFLRYTKINGFKYKSTWNESLGKWITE